ncbi:MAG: phage major capsid protein [Planctomycetaceae bacterium]|nr:phage major capsid protein [Planctomycetaceae bacterium]
MGVMAQAASDSRDKAIAIGSGVGEPLGLLSADGVTDLPITTLTYANLVSLKESVDQRFHGDPSFAFFGNQRVRAKLHSIVDSNGRPIFLNDATTAFKDQLFGYPYRTNRFFPNSFIGCGSLRHYLWFDRRQMSIATSREASNAFTTDSTLVRLIERADGKVPELAADAFARATGLTGIS